MVEAGSWAFAGGLGDVKPPRPSEAGAAALSGCLADIMAADGVLPEPPRSPEPCDPACPGWAVFWTGGMDDHLYADATEAEARAHRVILACDACWYGRADAPGDEVYETHPGCLLELDREVAQALAEAAERAEPPKAPEPCAECGLADGWEVDASGRRFCECARCFICKGHGQHTESCPERDWPFEVVNSEVAHG